MTGPVWVPSYPRKHVLSRVEGRVSRLIPPNKPGFPRQPEADPSEAFGGCAGMTKRGEHHVECSIFMLYGRA